MSDPKHRPDSRALLTDLYQLTMAYAYWRSDMAERRAAFHLIFREQPFDGGFSIASGLEAAIEFIEAFRFQDEDLQYLATLQGANERPLFESAFLEYLAELKFSCDVDAMPEGTAVFPHEPLVRVVGPVLQAQLLETPLLNLVNFATLVATKSARICLAARGDSVLEFGLRRAQGPDGGLTASRAAYVGGCHATSNVLAGKQFGIPVRGTHAHSWVMCFDEEFDAFQTYAEAMPNNCVFLVDTYDTLAGVTNAIRVGRWLREHGHEMLGIRLDSGDLAQLSIDARALLDEAGFPDAAIVASSDLDETKIAHLKHRGATIVIWGVGTRLATAYDQPALGGVYKLAALQSADGQWQRRVKVSNTPIKTSNPGIMQVRRYGDDHAMQGDVIYDELLGIDDDGAAQALGDGAPQSYSPETPHEDLLVPIFRAGQRVYDPPPIDQSRARTLAQLGRLPQDIKRLKHPAAFTVGLEENLAELKAALIAEHGSQVGKKG